MSKIIAICMLVAFPVFAQGEDAGSLPLFRGQAPSDVAWGSGVTAGVIVTPDGQYNVTGGLYLNEPAVAQVQTTIGALKTQNTKLAASIVQANADLVASEQNQGVPAWMPIAATVTAVVAAVAGGVAIAFAAKK